MNTLRFLCVYTKAHVAYITQVYYVNALTKTTITPTSGIQCEDVHRGFGDYCDIQKCMSAIAPTEAILCGGLVSVPYLFGITHSMRLVLTHSGKLISMCTSGQEVKGLIDFAIDSSAVATQV